MSWSRFDDLYDDHPKVMAAMHASPLAAALHAHAITAASRRESDGLVDPFWLLARAPDKRKREEALQILERLHLFDVIPVGETFTRADDKGYEATIGPFDEPRHVVHDYLDYNPSSTQLQDRRRKDAERKANGRRKESGGSPMGVRADISRTPDGPRGRAGADPRPNPNPIPSEEQQAATPQRSRADTTSRSRAETVACPRCGVQAGEKCDGVRGKRESAHLERHHAVGELLDRGGYAAAKAPKAARTSHTYSPDADMVALRDQHFPGVEVGTVESAAFMLRQRRCDVTPEALAELLRGDEELAA